MVEFIGLLGERFEREVRWAASEDVRRLAEIVRRGCRLEGRGDEGWWLVVAS